ncbi:FRG domain-containing protein [Cupriavidus necator]
MNGQWLGTKYSDDSLGRDADLVVNLDRVGDNYEGYLYHWPRTPPYIGAAIPFNVPVSENPFRFESLLLAFTGQIDVPFPFVDPSLYASNVMQSPQSLARRVYVEGDWNGNRMRLSCTTDLGGSGHGVLHRMPRDQSSRITAPVLDWKEAKEALFGMPYRKYIYRGQASAAWPLRSLFHREGRANLYRYTQDDIPLLHKRLSGLFLQPMNINVNDDRGGFVHLLQHHGYPTPLLDWSFSPFVAAFFAFRARQSQQSANGDECVRVFRLNYEAWLRANENIPMLATPRSHLSFLEFPAQNNPRVIPQHALSSVTSVDDVERHIQVCETRCKQTFLDAFDIPVSQVAVAMADLRLMGVTVGALFPGIDGACEEMRSLRFPSN